VWEEEKILKRNINVYRSICKNLLSAISKIKKKKPGIKEIKSDLAKLLGKDKGVIKKRAKKTAKSKRG